LFITFAEINLYNESVISAFETIEYGVILIKGKSAINDFNSAFSLANFRLTDAKLK
jgi:hypothetical protein